MRKIICVNTRRTFPSQLQIGKVYYLNEDTVFLDYEGDSYGRIYSDPYLNIEVGNMLLDHFDFEDSTKKLFVFDNLYQYINTNQSFLLKDIVKWCVRNINEPMSQYILELIEDRNLITGENLCKRYSIYHLSLDEFIRFKINRECLKYMGYELYCLD